MKCYKQIIWFFLAVTYAMATAATVTNFSSQYAADFAKARGQVDVTQSLTPLVDLLGTYTNSTEQSELCLEIGRIYSQGGGFVDPTNSIAYLTKAIDLGLSDRDHIQALMWRGNMYERIEQVNDALRDYLTGLISCSQYNLAYGWPEILPPKEIFSASGNDPKTRRQREDYNRYRRQIDLRRKLFMHRYYLIDAVKRSQTTLNLSEEHLLIEVGKMTPDPAMMSIIRELITTDNKRPWP